jgi:hypothetical protein
MRTLALLQHHTSKHIYCIERSRCIEFSLPDVALFTRNVPSYVPLVTKHDLLLRRKEARACAPIGGVSHTIAREKFNHQYVRKSVLGQHILLLRANDSSVRPELVSQHDVRDDRVPLSRVSLSLSCACCLYGEE